jgi:hypothetical protein
MAVFVKEDEGGENKQIRISGYQWPVYQDIRFR